MRTCRRCGNEFERIGGQSKNCQRCRDETARGSCLDCGAPIERQPGRTGQLPKRCPPCAKRAKYKQSQASKDRQWANNPEYRRKERERRRKQMREWREKNPDRARANDRRWKSEKWASDPEWRDRQILGRIASRYGLSPEKYAELRESQQGKCAICGGEPKPERRLHIDHDHRCCSEKSRSCGACIRGLLCDACNVGIGMLQDDPALLRAAVAYLEAPPFESL